MEPSIYVPIYLEYTYTQEHGDLTEAARQLLHDDIGRHPERYATSEHAQALLSYQRVHDKLMLQLDQLEDVIDDEEFMRKETQLFQNARTELFKIWHTDRFCVDAQLVDIQLSQASLDAQLNDLMKLESQTREHLERNARGFDEDAPGFWNASQLGDMTPADATRTSPDMIGWLHTLEVISQTCIASARYKPAMRYARMVMRAEGYPNHAEGTLLLALARLEDEDGFFQAAREIGADAASNPWFLLGRTLLLYKLGRKKAAQRALREFSNRCDGGAFFLLNPTYLAPYLPVRPEPRESWDLAHQAVWEADGIIMDVPDFTLWAASIDGIDAASERFADRNGF